MNVYLVRHAEAEPKEVDAERPLTREGRRDARRLAAVLRSMRLSVDAIWHSHKLRSKETAEAMAKAVQSKSGLVCRRDLRPNGDAPSLAAEIGSMDRDLMLVGHEPHLGRLAACLLCQGKAALLDLGKPSAACLSRDDETGSWRVRWLLSAELLAALPRR